MADSRIIGLNELTEVQLQTLLGSLNIPIDDPSFSDALRVKLDIFLSSAVVAQDSSINYKALTPAGFAASLATETRRGTVELASDSEITNKSNTNVIGADKQGVMQAQWNRDWFQTNGTRPKIVTRDQEDWAQVKSMSYHIAWKGPGTNSPTFNPFSPSEIGSQYIRAAFFDLVYLRLGVMYTVRDSLQGTTGASTTVTYNGNFPIQINNIGDGIFGLSNSSNIDAIAGFVSLILG